MLSFKSIALIAAAFAVGAECSVVPAVAAAPLVAPAAVGYAHAVPQNIPPFASQVNVENRALSPLATTYAATYTSVPYAAAPYFANAAPLLPAPYTAVPYGLPAPYTTAPYGLPASYASPYPYAAAAPLVRAPIGLAPAFVR